MTRRDGRARDAAWIAIALAGGLALAGCAGVPLSADAPEVELVALDALPSTGDKQRFALTFLLTNPNADALPAADLRYTVRLAGQGYLRGAVGAPVHLAGGARQTLRVELETDSVSSASSMLEVARDNALSYDLSGELVLNGQPPRTLAFEFSGDVPITVASDD